MPRWTDWALPAFVAATIGQVLTDWQLFDWVGRGSLLLYLAMQWRHQTKVAKVALGVSAAAAVATAHLPDPLEAISTALDQFMFLGSFIASVGMLRVAAGTSQLVRECGRALIQQPPRWRYPIVSLGALVFGFIINLGVLALLGTMVQRGNTLNAAGTLRVQQIRERRMMSSLLRGFALVPLISPMAVSSAIVLSHMPQLRYVDLLSHAFLVGGAMFCLGWLLDAQQRPSSLATLPPSATLASLRPLLPFGLLLTVIVSSVFASATLLQVNLPVAVIFTTLFFSWLWVAWQRRRLGGGLGLRRASVSVARRAAAIFGSVRGEVALVGGAGFVSSLLQQLIEPDLIAGWLLDVGAAGPWLVAAAALTVVAAAQLAINPIITTTLLIGLFPDPLAVGVPPVSLAVGLLTGWSLAVASSPMTASMLILARICNTSPYVVSYRWNAPFILANVVLIMLWLPLLAYLQS